MSCSESYILSFYIKYFRGDPPKVLLINKSKLIRKYLENSHFTNFLQNAFNFLQGRKITRRIRDQRLSPLDRADEVASEHMAFGDILKKIAVSEDELETSYINK